jgi:bacteriorhodopsin
MYGMIDLLIQYNFPMLLSSRLAFLGIKDEGENYKAPLPIQ